MKATLIFLILILSTIVCKAQDATTQYIFPDYLKKLETRDVVLVIPADLEDSFYIAEKDLNKSGEKKQEDAQRRFVLYGNRLEFFKQRFESVVRENWNHGDVTNIRVMTDEEAHSEFKKKGESYAVLTLRSSYGQDMIIFQPGERFGTQIFIGFPMIESGHSKEYTEADWVTTLRILNNYVTKAMTVKRKYEGRDFIWDEIKENCEMRPKVTTHFNSDYMFEVNRTDIEQSWQGPFTVLDNQDFFGKYHRDSEDAFAVFFIFETAFGKEWVPSRIIIQPSTGKIIAFGSFHVIKEESRYQYSKHFLEGIKLCDARPTR